MAIEIVSFPINSMVIFHSYVSLPEGTAKVTISVDEITTLSWLNLHSQLVTSHVLRCNQQICHLPMAAEIARFFLVKSVTISIDD